MVKDDLRWGGFLVGERWSIQEENSGDNSQLVFRDMLTTINDGTDARYTMQPRKRIDL